MNSVSKSRQVMYSLDCIYAYIANKTYRCLGPVAFGVTEDGELRLCDRRDEAVSDEALLDFGGRLG